jgi:alcohol dehydrogenase (NADP+)
MLSLLSGSENYCENGNTQTYGSKDRDGSITQGGYSKFFLVDEDFVLSVPNSIDLAEAGPLLCAGITTYSPLVLGALLLERRSQLRVWVACDI